MSREVYRVNNPSNPDPLGRYEVQVISAGQWRTRARFSWLQAAKKRAKLEVNYYGYPHARVIDTQADGWSGDVPPIEDLEAL